MPGPDGGKGWIGLHNYHGNFPDAPDDPFYRWADGRPYIEAEAVSTVQWGDENPHGTDCIKANFLPTAYTFHHVDCEEKNLFACQYSCVTEEFGEA